MAIRQAKSAKGEVGRTVQAKRMMLGWSRGELAGRSGVSTSMVQRIEEGARNPSRETAQKLAGALGLNALELLRQAGRFPELKEAPMDDAERELVTLFRRLSPGFRRAMLAAAQAYLSTQGAQVQGSPRAGAKKPARVSGRGKPHATRRPSR